jgi:DNA-nicking Smr family endonuclease
MKRKPAPQENRISDEERELFRDTVGGDITPVKHDRVLHNTPKPRPRRRGSSPIADTVFLSDSRPTSHMPGGVQKKTLKQLRNGQIAIEGVIDLHGQQREQADQNLTRFLHEAQLNNHRCILIIHGQGHHSENNTPVIKNLTHAILIRNQSVLSYAEARPKHGGGGATYALLRKR